MPIALHHESDKTYRLDISGMGRINLTAFTLGLALVATGASLPGRFDGTVSAQALNPCALLTTDEVDSLAPNTNVAAGIASSVPAYGYMSTTG